MGIFRSNAGAVQSAGEATTATTEADAAAETPTLASQMDALQRQCADILEQVKGMNNQLSQLAQRESQLRAVLEREAALQPHREHLEKVIVQRTRPR